MTKYLVRCYSSIRTHKQTHRMKQLNLVNCTQAFLHIIFIFRSQFRYTRRAKTEGIFQIKRTHMTNNAKKKYFCFRRNFFTDIEHVEPIFLFAFIVCNDVCASYTIHVFMWSNQFFFSVLWFWDTLKWKRIICDNRWKIYYVTEKKRKTKQKKFSSTM